MLYEPAVRRPELSQMKRFGERKFLASSTVSVERSRRTVSVRRITILASASEPNVGRNCLRVMTLGTVPI